jgi:hypothetical protein
MNPDPAIAQPKAPIPPENKIEFSVIGTNGDSKFSWDKTKPVEVEAARDHFKRLRKEGYLVYKLNPKDDSKGEQVTEFNAEEGSYIAAPAMRGG